MIPAELEKIGNSIDSQVAQAIQEGKATEPVSQVAARQAYQESIAAINKAVSENTASIVASIQEQHRNSMEETFKAQSSLVIQYHDESAFLFQDSSKHIDNFGETVIGKMIKSYARNFPTDFLNELETREAVEKYSNFNSTFQNSYSWTIIRNGENNLDNIVTHILQKSIPDADEVFTSSLIAEIRECAEEKFIHTYDRLVTVDAKKDENVAVVASSCNDPNNIELFIWSGQRGVGLINRSDNSETEDSDLVKRYMFTYLARLFNQNK